MGTWDAGNFDNDDAMDQLGGLVSEMVQKIEFAIDNELLEPDETQGVWLPCQVEILTLFAQRFNVTLPSVETITRWRDEYIEVWEGYIDELEPTQTIDGSAGQSSTQRSMMRSKRAPSSIAPDRSRARPSAAVIVSASSLGCARWSDVTMGE